MTPGTACNMTPRTYVRRMTRILLVMISVEPILVVSQVSFTCNSATDPGSCSCTEKTISCQNRTPLLESVPLNLRTKAETINLSNNKITRILEDDFRSVGVTETIILSNNEIVSIHKNAFLSLPLLQKLYLDGNNLTLFTTDTLNIRNLFALQTLNLSSNPIHEIDERTLLHIGNFQVEAHIDSSDLLCTCQLLQIRWELRQMFSILSTQKALSAIYCNTGTQLLSLYALRMEDATFLQCIGTPIVYAHAKVCPSCDGANTLSSCDQNVMCEEESSFCESRYSFDLLGGSISFNCTNKDTCLSQEKKNRMSCTTEGTETTECYFCCFGESCEPKNEGGLFIEHKFFLSFIKQHQLSKKGYGSDNITKAIRRTLHNFIGGIDVRVQDYFSLDEDDKIRVSAKLYATVFNVQSAQEIKEKIAKDFLDKANKDDGYFKDQNVDLSTVFLADSDKPHCLYEVTKHSDVELIWKDAYVGEIRTQPNHAVNGRVTKHTRACIQENMVPKWSKVTTVIIQNMQETTSQPPETQSPPAIAAIAATSMLNNVTQLAFNLHQSRHLSHPEYQRVVEQLEELAQEENIAVPGVSRAVVFCVNEILEHHTQQLADERGLEAKRMLDVIEKVAERTPLTNGSFKYVEKLLAVSGFRLPNDTTGELVMSISGFLSTGDLTAGNLDIEIKEDISTERTSINLPLASVSDSPAKGRIAFILYATDELFKSNHLTLANNTKYHLVKPIMSVSIPDSRIDLLEEKVLITLLHADKGTHQPCCVYWKVPKNGHLGEWSSDGCELVSSSENKTVCACSHLTNFALLMDVYGLTYSVSEANLEMLSIISIVGSSISFCCLVMTVFTYTVFRNLRRHSPSKIVYNLCWALLLFNGLFLLGRYFPTILREAVRCKAMAALLHYSLLASMFWMSVNAFYMYISVVKVFNVQIARFILKCFLFAWGLPAVLVVLTLLINDTENYGRLYTNFCWIRKPAFYVTLVSPVATSLLINLAVFCLSMIEISKSNKRHSSMLINERKSFMANFRVAFVLLILLGLTWTFAFFSFGELGTLFSYLFSIFNSLQGMFIFTFYCLLKREVHNAWLVLCGCQIEDIVITSKYSESRVSRSSLSKQSKYYEFKFTTSKDSGSSSAQEETCGTLIN